MASQRPPFFSANLRFLVLGSCLLAAALGMGYRVVSDAISAGAIPQVEIQIDPRGIAALQANHRSYVRSQIRIDSQRFIDVGVHLKGGPQTLRPLTENPSLTIDLSRYGGTGRFRGWRKIHLNNSVEDPTFLKEQIGGDLFRAAGVPAPRAMPVRVRLNGRMLGLYVLKEGFAPELLAGHFKRTDGDWYDVEDVPDFNQPLKRQPTPASSREGPQLQQLLAAARDPDLEQRWQKLHQFLNVEGFISFLAMEAMTCHWDGYYVGRNNFRIYADPETGRCSFLPAGMDQLFSNPAFPWNPRPNGLLAAALLELPEGQAAYAARFRELFDQVYQPAAINARARAAVENLRGTLSRKAFRQLDQEVNDLCAQISQRKQFLSQQLSGPPPEDVRVRAEGLPLTHWNLTDAGAALPGRNQGGYSASDSLYLRSDRPGALSWRKTVHLAPGAYRFSAAVRVEAARALPYGKAQGARLRVGGTPQASPTLLGTTGWTDLSTRFTVSSGSRAVELICEFRAYAGEAWFRGGTLYLEAHSRGAGEGSGSPEAASRPVLAQNMLSFPSPTAPRSNAGP